ncbi:MAG TPA: SMC-Scp complex subunit ScpB [Candidatus Binatia bacterium]|jgi:segregation and condensation protein B|nr:SMC-Scp complex subunit ScpB [Candidatus Binatia bacterium]
MEVDQSSSPEEHLNGVNGVVHDAPVAEAPAADAEGPPAIIFAPPPDDVVAPTPDEAPVEAADTAALEPILESLLLASGQPVPLARLVETLDGHDRRAIVAALKSLTDGYERDNRGFRIVHVAGGWQLRSAPEHGPWVRRLLGGRPPRLSRPMLETLAIIAYRQPCTRTEIEAIRGVDADAVVSTLLERRLIRIQGRKESPGRPLLYATTRDFLEVFGLPDIGALPPLNDLGDGAELLAARDLTIGPDGVHPTPPADAAPAEPEPEPMPVMVADEDGTVG